MVLFTEEYFPISVRCFLLLLVASALVTGAVQLGDIGFQKANVDESTKAGAEPLGRPQIFRVSVTRRGYVYGRRLPLMRFIARSDSRLNIRESAPQQYDTPSRVYRQSFTTADVPICIN
jgi:hypothetical protein